MWDKQINTWFTLLGTRVGKASQLGHARAIYFLFAYEFFHGSLSWILMMTIISKDILIFDNWP